MALINTLPKEAPLPYTPWNGTIFYCFQSLTPDNFLLSFIYVCIISPSLPPVHEQQIKVHEKEAYVILK